MEDVERMTDRVAALVEEGRLEEALGTAEAALAKAVEERGEKDRKARECRNNVAMVLQRMGRHSRAISLCEEGVKAAREGECEGESVSECVTLMENLASLYVSVSDNEKALRLCDDVAPMIEKMKSQSLAPTVVTALHNLGALYQRLGDKERALKFLEESLTLSRDEKSNEESDKRLGESLNSLACAHRKFGDKERARELFKESLEIYRRVLGDTHRITLLVTENFALLEEDEGRETSAAELYASVLKGRSETLGERHKDTMAVRVTLGFLYFAQGKMSEALPLLEDSLSCLREENGNEDQETIVAMKNVAVASRKNGDIGRARELYEEIVSLREKLLSPSDPLLRKSLDDLSDVLLCMKEYSTALPILERVAKLSREESGGNENLTTARVLDSLGFVLEQSGERKRALEIYKEALDVTRAAVGASHEETAAALARVGDWHAAGEDYAQAIDVYRQVLAIRTDVLGPNDYDTENAKIAIEQWEECL